MVVVQSLLAVLRFILELILVAVYWTFGFGFGSAVGGTLGAVLSWVLGLGLAALVVVIWGVYVAPRAPRRSREPTRFFLELALFFSGMALLWAMSQLEWGIALFLAFIADRLLLDRLGVPRWAAPRSR